MWPQEVRGDLREALKAKYKADLSTSAAYLQRYASSEFPRYFSH